MANASNTGVLPPSPLWQVTSVLSSSRVPPRKDTAFGHDDDNAGEHNAGSCRHCGDCCGQRCFWAAEESAAPQQRIAERHHAHEVETTAGPCTDPMRGSLPPASITVTNVVSSVDMTCSVDMMDVALRGRNTQFTPRSGQNAVFLSQRGGSTATVHASGKVVFMGGRCEASARTSARRHVRSIQTLG